MKTRNTTTLTLSEKELHEIIRREVSRNGFSVPPDALVTLIRDTSGWWGSIISATVMLWDNENVSPKA